MEAENTLRHSSGNSNGGSTTKSRLDTSIADSAHPKPAEETEDSIISPITSPPYWVQSHHRSFSNISAESVASGAITLQDNTEDGGDDTKNDACWAKSVYIEDFLIINGSRTNIGAFVIWIITVETLQVRGKLHVPELWKADWHREAQCGFENDTRSLTI